MLGNGRKFLFILQINFIGSITKVVTQDVELSLEIDTAEEQQLLGNEKNYSKDLEKVPSGDEHFENSNKLKIIGEENKSKANYSVKAEGTNDKLKGAIASEEENLVKKLNGEKPPSLEFKAVAENEEEPGFDLTPEEMRKFKIWKDGVIPYYIDVVSFNDAAFRDKIRHYLQMVNSGTSLTFVELSIPPTDDNERWVLFVNRRGLLGCAEHSVRNFTNQGVQPVVLGYDCMNTKGELAEAVMSIAGVPAQHNAPDRDQYIKVNTENIKPDKAYLFEKLSDNDWLFHDLEYDFRSATHYDLHKYSANGRATIEPKKQSDDLSPAITLSTIDFQKIKMLYNYFTRNKKLEVPVCRKLFKPNSKFEQRNPINNEKFKARKKPSKYTGIADPEDEPIEPAVEEKDQDELNKDNDNVNSHKGDENEKVVLDEVGYSEYGDGYIEDKISYNQGANRKENQRTTEKYMAQLNAKKKKTVIDPLALLSDFESNERVKLSFKLPGKIDPLSYLSDYQTDDERDRKRMLQHIKKKTLNYPRKKQALKFTNVGNARHTLKRSKNYLNKRSK